MKARFFLILILLAGCQQSKLGKKSYPEYHFQSLSGKNLEITKIKNRLELPSNGKPVLFVFIQASCNTCFEGIEHLKRLYESYRDQITFIPILQSSNDLNQSISEAKSINELYHLDFDFYFEETKDDGSDFLQSFQPQTSTNFILLYDSKLRLFQEYEGLVPEEMLEFDLQQVLKHNQNKE